MTPIPSIFGRNKKSKNFEALEKSLEKCHLSKVDKKRAHDQYIRNLRSTKTTLYHVRTLLNRKRSHNQNSEVMITPLGMVKLTDILILGFKDSHPAVDQYCQFLDDLIKRTNDGLEEIDRIIELELKYREDNLSLPRLVEDK